MKYKRKELRKRACCHVSVIAYAQNYGEEKNVLKRIEEVSKLSGISKRALQYYDDEGLLRAKRSKENYRLYDENDMKKLWEILWYKEMGFQLREIKEIFAVPKKERNLYLEQRMKVIEGEIQNLEVQRKWVQYIEDCGMIEALPCDKENQQNYLEQIKRIKRIHEDLSQLHMEEENEKSRKVELS